MKRVLDIFVSLFGIVLFFPLVFILILIMITKDRSSPFYIANRVGKSGKLFRMVKLRSMIVDADKTGVDSTSSNDKRITKIGRFIRKYKIDEITQLWNVLIGDMSLVGPRPNVKTETDLYSEEEKVILSVRPGITDFSSIVFADEGEILSNKTDPDLSYNQLIRPWKSRLGIYYVNNKTIVLDIIIIIYTLIAIINRKASLNYIVKTLIKNNVSQELIEVCKREKKLVPAPPPGLKDIIKSR